MDMCREEGSNGDREMAAAVHMAGLQPWDVTMSDLLAGRISLSQFQGEHLHTGLSDFDCITNEELGPCTGVDWLWRAQSEFVSLLAKFKLLNPIAVHKQISWGIVF